MPFDWLTPAIPEHVLAAGPARRAHQATEEVRYRAGLLLRLGYDEAHATHRCTRNQAWGHEMSAEGALTEKQVTAIVRAVYSGGSLKRA